MRKTAEIIFAIGITIAALGWVLLVVGGPILLFMPLVKISAIVMFSGLAIVGAVGLACLWVSVMKDEQ